MLSIDNSSRYLRGFWRREGFIFVFGIDNFLVILRLIYNFLVIILRFLAVFLRAATTTLSLSLLSFCRHHGYRSDNFPIIISALHEQMLEVIALLHVR